MTAKAPLPLYRVRESLRAKHIHLRFSLRDGLEVVVPPGFDCREIPELLREKERWIKRTRRELEVQRALLDPRPRNQMPDAIALLALSETWRLDAVPASGRLEVREQDGLRLQIAGPVHDPERWRAGLKRWTARRARSSLGAWVEREEEACELSHLEVSIRWQKSRWGSCSRRSGLSLNAGLLFLPPHLVRYVILHELCHTERMDHSPAFWRRLETFEPRARELRAELRSAWHYVPSWCEPAPAGGPAVDACAPPT